MTDLASVAASGTAPRASVIVAVYNGAPTLRPCVESLLALDYPAGSVEILCVDNASTDSTPRILESYGGRIRLLREVVPGPAAARNRGLAEARGDVVAFTDADCVADRAWLRRLVRPLSDETVGVAGGRILSRPSRNPIEIFGEEIHDHARALGEFVPPFAITMNWASRTAVLAEVGGFNAELLRSSDVDCAYRLVARGYRLVYEADAVIYHRNERTPWGLMHEGYLHGFHGAKVNRLHQAFLRRARLEKAGASSARPPVRTPHWSDPLWRSLFNLGKRAGRLRAARAAVGVRSV